MSDIYEYMCSSLSLSPPSWKWPLINNLREVFCSVLLQIPSANTIRVPLYWPGWHNHWFGFAALSLKFYAGMERMTLSSCLFSKRALSPLGFSRSYFNLYIGTSYYAPIDHREVSELLYFQPFVSPSLLPCLFLACSCTQQPLSPAALLPWIANQANICFGSHLPNTPVFFWFIKVYQDTCYGINMSKNNRSHLLNVYFIWWYT